MSPFSQQIRNLREKRNLRQKDAAELLGYEQSYLSALEGGGKSAPQTEFVDLMIKRYELNCDEKEGLLDALQRSRRRYLLPLKASIEEYDLFYKLISQVGKLSPRQITLIQIALSLGEKAAE